MRLCWRPFPGSRSRRAIALAALCLASLGAGRTAAAEPRPWTIAQPGPWVQEMRVPSADRAVKTEGDSDEIYLLVDHQVRLGPSPVEYRRFVWTPLSTEGVQNAPDIQIGFDPSCERLVLHHVRLYRNGRDVSSFSPGDVRVIQQESDLDEQIYSGQLTAVVFVRDLRPGDIVDYAYSIEGANPILHGGYDDELALAYGSPVRVLRHAIQVPGGIALHVKAHNTAVAPRVTPAGTWRTYSWELHDVPAVLSDDDEPDWYHPEPRVEVSTFESWEAIARWARDLFEGQLRPSAEVVELARRWRGATGGQAAAALAAARFVQDEVRYLGIEMGPNSHEPHPPAWVLRQRFGDCKDKALLLVALLRELGIDAAPALVSTSLGRGLDSAQPSPFAFDHAIVQAVIQGRTYWIDATESGKGGRLEDWAPPAFERALVLRPETTRLTPIPLPDLRVPLIEVKEVYTLGASGAPVRLDVITTYRGEEADNARHSLASTGARDLAKKCLDYYARENIDIRAVRPPIPRDDRDRNVVTVAEAYEMATFWKHGERDLFGWQIRDVLPRAAASTRAAPLAVLHPVHVAQQIVVRAPRAFRLSGRHVRIAHDAFAFSSDLQVTGREMRLSFDYRSAADSVPPGRLEAHQKAMERVRDELSFVLASDLASPETRQWDEAVAWVVGTLFALWLGGWIALRARVWRRRGFGARS